MNIDDIIQKQRDFAPILAQKPLKYRLDKLEVALEWQKYSLSEHQTKHT